MTSQLALAFDDRRAGRSRKSDPRTSLAAARSCNAPSQRQRILLALSEREQGATTEELEKEFRVRGDDGEWHGPSRNTISSRLKQMEHDGLVEAFSQRLNDDGNPMQVWWLKPQPWCVDVVVAKGRL